MLSPLLPLLPSSAIHQHPSSDSSLNQLPHGGLRLPKCPPWRVSALFFSILVACGFPLVFAHFFSSKKNHLEQLSLVSVSRHPFLKLERRQFREHEASVTLLSICGPRYPSLCDVYVKEVHINACANPCSPFSLYLCEGLN